LFKGSKNQHIATLNFILQQLVYTNNEILGANSNSRVNELTHEILFICFAFKQHATLPRKKKIKKKIHIMLTHDTSVVIKFIFSLFRYRN